MTSNLWQDMRHAVRGLARRPLVSGVAIVSLAFGIGVNSAIFSAFERLFLRGLPVPAATEIVDLRVSGPRPGNRSAGDGGGLPSVLSYPLFRDIERADGMGFARVFALRNFGASVSFAGQSSTAEGILVSGSYFPALRLTPALGRLLGPEDDRIEGGHPVVVLSHAYWTTRFGGDRSAIGSSLVVNGDSMTIVGVAPEGFAGTIMLDAPAVGVLAAIPAIVARLDPNLPVEQPRTMADRLWESTTRDRVLSTLSSSFAALATLLAAIGLYAVLAYGVARRVREMGIRMALGATGGQVRRMVFGDVCWMAAVGIVLGSALAIGLGQLGQSMLFGVEGFEPRVLVAVDRHRADDCLRGGGPPRASRGRGQPGRRASSRIARHADE